MTDKIIAPIVSFDRVSGIKNGGKIRKKKETYSGKVPAKVSPLTDNVTTRSSSRRASHWRLLLLLRPAKSRVTMLGRTENREEFDGSSYDTRVK